MINRRIRPNVLTKHRWTGDPRHAGIHHVIQVSRIENLKQIVAPVRGGRFVKGQSYLPGIKAGDSYQPGLQEGQEYLPGLKAGQGK